MQTSWQEDKDSEDVDEGRGNCSWRSCLFCLIMKSELTFIILAQPEKKVSTIDDILQSCSMAGDVNLFLSERHNDEDDANTKRGQAASAFDAELEVMIAGEKGKVTGMICLTKIDLFSEPHWRQKGLAAEALSLLIHYASTSPTPDAGSSQLPTSSAYLPLPSDSFLVKVGFDNHPSIRLFEKLGFKEFKRSEVWKEVEMRLVDGGLGLETLPGPSAVLRWILA